MTSLQGHIGYTFRPRLWLTVDYTYFSGGETTLDGVRKRDRQESSRAGMVLSVPATQRYSLKFAWSNGVQTRIGGDFTTYTIAVQRAW